MHDALYKAYFVETKNIGDTDVLLEIVEANGLSVEDARKFLKSEPSRTLSMKIGRSRANTALRASRPLSRLDTASLVRRRMKRLRNFWDRLAQRSVTLPSKGGM